MLNIVLLCMLLSCVGIRSNASHRLFVTRRVCVWGDIDLLLPQQVERTPGWQLRRRAHHHHSDMLCSVHQVTKASCMDGNVQYVRVQVLPTLCVCLVVSDFGFGYCVVVWCELCGGSRIVRGIVFNWCAGQRCVSVMCALLQYFEHRYLRLGPFQHITNVFRIGRAAGHGQATADGG